MQEAIDECYDRLGRYMTPDITVSPILMLNGKERYVPYAGRCSRTGIDGQVIAHNKSDGTVVPTHTKLLWMLAYQNRVNNSSYRLSFGCLVLLPSTILSTTEWADRSGTRIPKLHVVETYKDLVRRVIGEDRYLFFAFSKNSDRTLGNGLRYSSGCRLEVNGEMKIAGLQITNQAVDFTRALQLSKMDVDWDAARKYHDLRNRDSGLTGDEHTEMLALKGSFGKHAKEMMRLSRQVSREDIRLAKWLAT